MPDLYISQILLQLYRNVIVWERICDGGKFFLQTPNMSILLFYVQIVWEKLRI